jgi:protein-tyrosine phosphatase
VNRPTRILVVCMGNICRSPTAEAVLRREIAARGLADRFEVDSAGTGDWHAGEPPDERARAAAARRGLSLDGAARVVVDEDFAEFDVIVAVDEENLGKLQRMAPPDAHAVVRKLSDEDVPDPYYGGDDAFDLVLDMVQTSCRRLLDELGAGGDALRQD